MQQIKLTRQYWPILVVILVIVLYLGAAYQGGKLGFPLDDAWIHQTYARNFVRNGRWEFIPGVVSAGSTSPLWTLFLAVGYLLHIPLLLWAYLLGAISLLGLAFASMRVWRLLWPEYAALDWAVGVVIASSWSLIWAAVSGMETLLFAALGMSILAAYLKINVTDSAWSQFGEMGILSGLLILTRPDGVVLILLVCIGVLFSDISPPKNFFYVTVYIVTALMPVLPYFLFNWMASGTVWPNTFYAKQAEYAVILTVPLFQRVTQLLYFSFGGPDSGWQGMSSPHLLLLPGLLVMMWNSVRRDIVKRNLFYTVPLLWAGGHVFLYAWRLPLTFQHGRYLLAAMPIWMLFGLAGWLFLLKNRKQSRFLWIVQQASRYTFTGIIVFFLFLGANAYAIDVAFIEGEMVTMAKWIAENTPDNALIASHDIGAIGYFGERPLLDLAGLISPEVIPILDNNTLLANYIKENNAHYFVTAPGWPYADIVNQSKNRLLFSTDYPWTLENGRNNMTIYLLQDP
jgi:hypothetical protein